MTSFSRTLFNVGVNDAPRYEFIEFLGLFLPLYRGIITLCLRDGGIYPVRKMSLNKTVGLGSQTAYIPAMFQAFV